MSTRLIAILCLFTFAPLGGAAFGQTDPAEEARTLTAEVVGASQDIQLSLDLFARSTTGDLPVGDVDRDEALLAASRSGLALDARITELESLVGTLDIEEAQLAREAVRQGKARLTLLDEALQWSPSTTGSGLIEFCSGFLPCLYLRHACPDTGCYNCYEGLTDCGCFDPCP